MKLFRLSKRLLSKEYKSNSRRLIQRFLLLLLAISAVSTGALITKKIKAENVGAVKIESGSIINNESKSGLKVGNQDNSLSESNDPNTQQNQSQVTEPRQTGSSKITMDASIQNGSANLSINDQPTVNIDAGAQPQNFHKEVVTKDGANTSISLDVRTSGTQKSKGSINIDLRSKSSDTVREKSQRKEVIK